jgi:hypothetical protein
MSKFGIILFVCALLLIILISIGDYMIYRTTNLKSTYSKLDSLDKIDTALKVQMAQIKDKTKNKKDSVSILSYTRYNQLNTKILIIEHQRDSIKNKLN